MSEQNDFESRVAAIKADLLKLKEAGRSEAERMFLALYPAIVEMEHEKHSRASILEVLKRHHLDLSPYRFAKLKAAEARRRADALNKHPLSNLG